VYFDSHGLVGVRTASNMEQFRRPLIVVYYKLDFTGKRKKETTYWRNRFVLSTSSIISDRSKRQKVNNFWLVLMNFVLVCLIQPNETFLSSSMVLFTHISFLN